MTVKTSLLAGAAVLALTGAAGAEAAPVRHHAHAAAKHHVAAKPSAEKGEVEALKAQVQELTARLDAQEEAQRATQAQASVAQSQAADATVKADTAQSTALAAQQAAPAQVAAAISKLPKPKPTWADSTVLSGRMYFNFSNINQLNNGVRQANDGTGFDIKRFYFGVDHKFSNVFAANLTMDVSNVVGKHVEQQLPGCAGQHRDDDRRVRHVDDRRHHLPRPRRSDREQPRARRPRLLHQEGVSAGDDFARADHPRWFGRSALDPLCRGSVWLSPHREYADRSHRLRYVG